MEGESRFTEREFRKFRKFCESVEYDLLNVVEEK